MFELIEKMYGELTAFREYANKRFDKLETRFDKLETKVDVLENKLDDMEANNADDNWGDIARLKVVKEYKIK